jgi:hypothetical protein
MYDWDSGWPVLGPQTPPELHKKWESVFPDSYAWTFSTEDENAVRFWVDNPGVVDEKGLSVLLYGGKGVGKTSLATTLSKEYTKRVGVDNTGAIRAFRPQFMVAESLYELLSTRSWHGLELYQKSISASILVLDDLRLSFSGYVANDYFERIHSCLQHRASNNLPTIITANKAEDRKDFQANCVTEFLGISSAAGVPEKFGKYRFIQLDNQALRPDAEWEL